MNITEQIVEFLKQGKSVDIPGIGNFTSRTITAHYDAATNSFLPTRQVIEFSSQLKGNDTMAEFIAAKECVGINTGRQMWQNYINTLKAKLEKSGEHNIPGLGVLSLVDGTYVFAIDEAANAINPQTPAVEGVKLYAPQYDVNPFDKFDLPMPTAAAEAPAEVPAEEVPAEEEPTATPAEEAPIEVPVAAPVAAALAAAASASAEEAPVAEAPATAPVEEPAAEEPVVEEPVAEEPKIEGYAIVDDIEDTEAPVEETPVAAAPEAEPEAESPATVPSEAPAAEEPVSVPVAEAPVASGPTPAEKEALEGLKVIEEMDDLEFDDVDNDVDNDVEETPKKKKRRLWPIFLALLLLLLGGCAVYYFYFMPQQKDPTDNKLDIEEMVTGSEGTESTTAVVNDPEQSEIYGTQEPTGNTEASEAETSEEATETTAAATQTASNNQTAAIDEDRGPRCDDYSNLYNSSKVGRMALNSDLITFEKSEIAASQEMVVSRLSNYIEQYAKKHQYSGAVEALKQRVNQYAGQRLMETMNATGFSIRNVMPYNDYVGDYCYDNLKSRKANRKRCEVQAEIMDEALLSDLLNQVVSENGIEKDAAPVVAAQPQATGNYRSTASYRTSSKKGFDVIAGYFANKNNADRMASKLKSQGCDAYIIEIQDGYYVSMGSAESRTKAEALYGHLKEWYRGDMVIKKF